MKYWKVELKTSDEEPATFRTCEEAKTADEAIEKAKVSGGIVFQLDDVKGTATQFTDAERADSETTVREWARSGTNA